MNSSLNFFLGRKERTISFAPQDSDALINAFFLEQIIGTLVRLSPSGRYEPYLAESWTLSEDSKTWKFRLKPGNRCEDGTLINAPNYIAGLKKTLRLLAGFTELPILNQLDGWNEFVKNGNSFPGLQATSDVEVRFDFSTKPSSGFLEYLGLPYMGFYCGSNFNSDGTWRDKNYAFSSSAYRLETRGEHFPIKLVRRDGWFASKQNSPHEIIFESDSFENSLRRIGPNSILYENLNASFETLDGFQIIRSIPSLLAYVSISPNRQLKDARKRREIRDAIDLQKRKEPFKFLGASMASTLYPQMKVTLPTDKFVSPTAPDERPLEPLVVFHAGGNTPRSIYLKNLVQESVERGLGYKLKFVEQSQLSKGHMEGWKDSKAFDLKLGAVDIGGGIENQLIKFMFCSKLGTGFSDPSGRICGLVETAEKSHGDLMSAEDAQIYYQKLSEILNDDACLIPVLHFGATWIVGEKVDMTGFSPNMGVPYFDQIEIK